MSAVISFSHNCSSNLLLAWELFSVLWEKFKQIVFTNVTVENRLIKIVTGDISQLPTPSFLQKVSLIPNWKPGSTVQRSQKLIFQDEWVIDQVCSVKMAGYCPPSLSASLWNSTQSAIDIDWYWVYRLISDVDFCRLTTPGIYSIWTENWATVL